MTGIKLISSAILLAVFIFTGSDVYAQKGRTQKATVVNKGNNGVPNKSKGNDGVPSKSKDNRVPSKDVVYKKPSTKVASVRTLPQKTVVVHKGTDYYYSNQKYYAYSGGSYVVIRPKVGFRIQTLPVGYVVVKHPSRNYFWFDGVFYIQTGNQYEVVEPAIGTIIYDLPSGTERVDVGGNVYYEFSNVLYSKVQVNGTRAYEVVGFIDQ